MAAAHFTIHAGDTRPILAVMEDESGPIDLGFFDEVRFLMWTDPSLAPVIDAVATIVDADIGEVRYDWKPAEDEPTPTPGETDTPGRYRAVFRAISESATPGQVSFPSDRYLIIEILP
jgi:hypothetical protein